MQHQLGLLLPPQRQQADACVAFVQKQANSLVPLTSSPAPVQVALEAHPAKDLERQSSAVVELKLDTNALVAWRELHSSGRASICPLTPCAPSASLLVAGGSTNLPGGCRLIAWERTAPTTQA